MRCVSALVCLCIVISQVSCKICFVDSVQIQPDFDINKFLGKWHEVLFLPQKLEWSIYDNYVFRLDTWNQASRVVAGQITYTDAGVCNDNIVTFKENVPGNYSLHYKKENVTMPFLVLETDYDNYAVAYTCRNISTSGTCNEVQAWVLSRTLTLTDERTNKSKEAIARECGPLQKIVVTPLDNLCPFPDEGTSTASREMGTVAFILVLCWSVLVLLQG